MGDSRRFSATALFAAGIALILLPAPGFSGEHTEKVLYRFASGNDGSFPEGRLIADAKGNLYGTTTFGGASSHGTVFRLAPNGKETVLYSFGGKKHGDGDFPTGDLIADAAGNFYGTTVFGGIDCGGFRSGCGTVFKVTPTGAETVLHAFTGSAGAYPVSGLTADADGNLYGATGGGGGSLACDGGCGTVFELTPAGDYSVLYAFKGRKNGDGEDPVGTLVRDARGNLYGATQWGGSGKCAHGCGIIFALTPDGLETVLHAFSGGVDGGYPNGLIQDADGNLYGTTPSGGGRGDCFAHDCGTVFKLTADGGKTVLYAFAGGSDGGEPWDGLTIDAKGNLYGATEFGGLDCDGYGRGCGTVFKLAPKGRETVLHRFHDDDGANPEGGLIADSAGNLYGTTYGGGLDCYGVGEGCGTVFKVKN